ncbi:MAG: serine/threonine protein kinase [Thermoguttaceae bacterium]
MLSSFADDVQNNVNPSNESQSVVPPEIVGDATSAHSSDSVSSRPKLSTSDENALFLASTDLVSPPSDSQAGLFPVKTSDTILPPGTVLGHFTVTKFIGGGGMGRVYLGVDKSLDRKVAIKVLHHQRAQDQASVARFMNEARSAARLNHEHIAQVYFAGQQGDIPFIAFEYVEGINIRAMIEQHGLFSVPQAITYLIQIVQAFSHAASHGVIHRDVKPSNIIITKSGKAKLIDMGLARLLKPTEANDDLTASGVTLGTFDYISPEQARAPRNADVRSDIYSLGCTFFFMLTGRPPFPEGNVLQKLLQHQGDEPPDIRTFKPNTPPEIAFLLQKMMAKDPRQRYQTPTTLLAALSEIAELYGLRPVEERNAAWSVGKKSKYARLLTNLPWISAILLFAVCFFLINLFVPNDDLVPPSVDSRTINDSGNHEATAAGTNNTGNGTSQTPGAAGGGTNQQTAKNGTLNDVTDFTPIVWDTAVADSGYTVLMPNIGSLSSLKDGNSGSNQVENNGSDSDLAGRLSYSVQVHQNGLQPRYASGLGNPLLSGGAYLGPTQQSNSAVTESTVSTLTRVPLSTSVNFLKLRGSAPVTADKTPLPNASPTLIVDPESTNTEQGVFTSLAAAISAAEKNSNILLRYNGVDRNAAKLEPISILDKKITIKAVKGYTPVVSFRPSGAASIKNNRIYMFLINGGSFSCEGIAFEMIVSQSVLAEKWSLIETKGPTQLEFTDCSFTVRNTRAEGTLPFHSYVTVFRIFSDVSGTATSSLSPAFSNVVPSEKTSGSASLQFAAASGSTFGYRQSEGTSLTSSSQKSDSTDYITKANPKYANSGQAEQGISINISNSVIRGETCVLLSESNVPATLNFKGCFIAIALPFCTLREVASDAESLAGVSIQFEDVLLYCKSALTRFVKSKNGVPLPVNWSIKFSAMIFNKTPILEFIGFLNRAEVLPQCKWKVEKSSVFDASAYAEVRASTLVSHPIDIPADEINSLFGTSVVASSKIFQDTIPENKVLNRITPNDLVIDKSLSENPAITGFPDSGDNTQRVDTGLLIEQLQKLPLY